MSINTTGEIRGSYERAARAALAARRERDEWRQIYENHTLDVFMRHLDTPGATPASGLKHVLDDGGEASVLDDILEHRMHLAYAAFVTTDPDDCDPEELAARWDSYATFARLHHLMQAATRMPF